MSSDERQSDLPDASELAGGGSESTAYPIEGKTWGKWLILSGM